MSHARHAYLPAAGRDVFLPLYDPLTKLLGADRARRKLFDQAAVQPDHSILDIGCGTGTFAVAIKRWLPTVNVVGLDPDPKALARSHRKAMAAGVSIRFDEGFANALPYADASFDRVFSSLMFHHLPQNAKLPTLCEVRRVLKPGGSLHLLDFVEPGRRSHNPLARWLHASEQMEDNTQERILSRMSEAGLLDARPVAFDERLFGRIVYYRASAPAQRDGALTSHHRLAPGL
jgi:ubiquinone/menaquinone biosynthesis C-methylase UbiE